MTRPAPALVDLAARRAPPYDLVVDAELLASACEHRMQGLLHSLVLAGEAGAGEHQEALAELSLRARRRTEGLWRTLERVQAAAAALDVEIATLKGPSAELRWYDRAGERPCGDLDVWLGGAGRGRVRDVVGALAPGHPILDLDVESLVAAGRLQSIELLVDGTEVDLHLDVLKLGVPSRLEGELWGRRVALDGPRGETVLVADPVAALLQLLLHLNKDRFRWLLGFADVVRLIDREPVDWSDLVALARRGGMETPVLRSLDVVRDELGIGRCFPAAPAGWRAQLWQIAWPARIRLAGDLGVASYRYRQAVLPFTLRGPRRLREAWASLLRRLLPERALVAYRNPAVPGSYFRRLAVGRFRRWQQRRELVAAARRRTSPSPGRSTPSR